MYFIDNLRERLEKELGEDLNTISSTLNRNASIKNIELYKKITEFKSRHSSLSNEMLEEALNLKKGKIADAINNYQRHYKGKWKNGKWM